MSLLRDSYRVNISYILCVNPPAARRAKTKLNYGPVSRAGLHGIEGAAPAGPSPILPPRTTRGMTACRMIKCSMKCRSSRSSVDHLFMPENFTVLESIYTHCISFTGSPRSRFVTICLHVRPCCTAFAISR